jgi:hypothetical protein
MDLNKMLDNMRHDAIAKTGPEKPDPEEMEELFQAILQIYRLSVVAHRDGLLGLEKGLSKKDWWNPDHPLADYLQECVMNVADGESPEMVTELATNHYWTLAPEGLFALAHYIVLRSTLLMQQGASNFQQIKMIRSLLPASLHTEFDRRIEDERMALKRESEIEAENEKARQKTERARKKKT